MGAVEWRQDDGRSEHELLQPLRVWGSRGVDVSLRGGSGHTRHGLRLSHHLSASQFRCTAWQPALHLRLTVRSGEVGLEDDGYGRHMECDCSTQLDGYATCRIFQGVLDDA